MVGRDLSLCQRQLPAHASDGHARVEQGQHLDVTAAPVGVAAVVRVEMNPELDVLPDQCGRLQEVSREYADDRELPKLLADDRRIPAEPALPSLVADDGAPLAGCGTALIAVARYSPER